jgi:mannose/fructose/N-acetylgalactosamine-specific phosphotransferase system component IIC
MFWLFWQLVGIAIAFAICFTVFIVARKTFRYALRNAKWAMVIFGVILGTVLAVYSVKDWQLWLLGIAVPVKLAVSYFKSSAASVS